jgi:cell division protein FtsB
MLAWNEMVFLSLLEHLLRSEHLAKTNFQYEKRQKELEKKRKKEEKLKRKVEKDNPPAENPEQPVPDEGTAQAGTP